MSAEIKTLSGSEPATDRHREMIDHVKRAIEKFPQGISVCFVLFDEDAGYRIGWDVDSSQRADAMLALAATAFTGQLINRSAGDPS